MDKEQAQKKFQELILSASKQAKQVEGLVGNLKNSQKVTSRSVKIKMAASFGVGFFIGVILSWVI